MFVLNLTDEVALSEDNLKVGDRFYTSEKFYRKSHNINQVKWVTLQTGNIEVVFLGYTNVFDGTIHQFYYDSETGYTDPPCFDQTKTHRVMVVQPILGKRYTKPFYILSPIQKSNYFNNDESSAKEK